MNTEKRAHPLRIAAFDLDGTVLHKGIMRNGVRKALTSLRESGVTVVIASGRDLAQIKADVRECFSYIVAANGAYVTGPGENELLCSHAMSREAVDSCLRSILRYGGGPTVFQCGKMMGAVRTPLCMPGGSLLSYRKTRLGYCESARFIPCLRLYAKFSPIPVYKVQGFFRSGEKCSAAAEEIRKFGIFEVLEMGDNTLEINMIGVTKACALAELCSILGYSTSEMVAFGDSLNDLEMLRASGFAVAMGNGSDSVKKIANYIAPHVSIDGAATAIYDIFGLPEQ